MDPKSLLESKDSDETVIKHLAGTGLNHSNVQCVKVRDMQRALNHPLRLVLGSGSLKELAQNYLGSSPGSATTWLLGWTVKCSTGF